MIYGCECTDRRCQERLSLLELEYAALAQAGAVVSRWCAVREGKRPLARRHGAVAVLTSAAVIVATARRSPP